MTTTPTTLEERIVRIFDTAGLSEEDRSLWMSRLSISGEQFQRAFVSLFSGEEEMLHFFTRDLRERIEAGNDQAKIAAVLDRERQYFESELEKAGAVKEQ